jgi:hypothetical protein
MSKITIPTQKLVYSKDINIVTDTQFSDYVTPSPTQEIVDQIPTVDVFFENYDVLFYQIPLTGSNSHSTLVEKSSEYLGLDLNLLLEQLNFLQEQNQQLQEQINQFNTNI